MSPSANRINFLLLFLALVCCCQSANAQGLTGQISGTLNDPNGGVVPNAKIEVINQETARAVARELLTARAISSCRNCCPALTRWSSRQTASKSFEQRGIVLTANERVDVRKITLEVGDVNQTVTVTAETALVQDGKRRTRGAD